MIYIAWGLCQSVILNGYMVDIKLKLEMSVYISRDEYSVFNASHLTTNSCSM